MYTIVHSKSVNWLVTIIYNQYILLLVVDLMILSAYQITMVTSCAPRSCGFPHTGARAQLRLPNIRAPLCVTTRIRIAVANSVNEYGQWGNNSLKPGDAIWRHRFWWTLAKVMACCPTAPSHYLSQWWLIITKVQWCSSEGDFASGVTAIRHYN